MKNKSVSYSLSVQKAKFYLKQKVRPFIGPYCIVLFQPSFHHQWLFDDSRMFHYRMHFQEIEMSMSCCLYYCCAASTIRAMNFAKMRSTSYYTILSIQWDRFKVILFKIDFTLKSRT